MLFCSLTADRVHAVALLRPPIQRVHAVAKTPSASPAPSLAEIQSSLKDIQSSLQLIEATQAVQGASLKRTGNWVVSATCTAPLASSFALAEYTTMTVGKHIVSTAEFCTIATQTTGAAAVIFGVIYAIIEQNQKTP